MLHSGKLWNIVQIKCDSHHIGSFFLCSKMTSAKEPMLIKQLAVVEKSIIESHNAC